MWRTYYGKWKRNCLYGLRCIIVISGVGIDDSVTALETHQYSAGQQITMKLMQKPRGSLRVLPASAAAAASDCTDNAEMFPPSITGTSLSLCFLLIRLYYWNYRKSIITDFLLTLVHNRVIIISRNSARVTLDTRRQCQNTGGKHIYQTA